MEHHRHLDYEAGSRRANNTNMQRYKTTLCKHFMQTGECQMAERCHFAHGEEDRRSKDDPLPNHAIGLYSSHSQHPPPGYQYNIYKTVLCNYFKQDGTCQFGDRCTFAHGESDLRAKFIPLTYASPPYQPSHMVPMGYPSPDGMSGYPGYDPYHMGQPSHMMHPPHHPMMSAPEPFSGSGVPQPSVFGAPPPSMGHHHPHHPGAHAEHHGHDVYKEGGGSVAIH